MLATMLRRTLFLTLALSACAGRAKHSVSLYEAGDYAGASRAADEGLAQHPDDDGLWAMKVRAALALGDADAVAKAYEGYVAHRGGDDKELLRDLATATLAQGLASPSAKLKIAAIDAISDLRAAGARRPGVREAQRRGRLRRGVGGGRGAPRLSAGSAGRRRHAEEREPRGAADCGRGHREENRQARGRRHREGGHGIPMRACGARRSTRSAR